MELFIIKECETEQYINQTSRIIIASNYNALKRAIYSDMEANKQSIYNLYSYAYEVVKLGFIEDNGTINSSVEKLQKLSEIYNDITKELKNQGKSLNKE